MLLTRLLFIFCFGLGLSGCSMHSDSLLPFSHSASNDCEPTDELWQCVREQFQLTIDTSNPEIADQIKWYSKHHAYLKQIAERSSPYTYYIYQQVKKRNLPGELVLLPILESAYDPFAYASTGAAGLWQIMPGTATGFGIKQDWWYDGRRDITASTRAALDYLTYLQHFFNGNWMLAVAAYDSGEGTVQAAIRHNTHRGASTDFWSLPLPQETQSYVPRLLALAAIVKNPQAYGLELPPIANEPYFAAVDVGTQIDLNSAAKLAGISSEELYRLNPGYNRWATDPTGPYRLLLPINKIEKFKIALLKLDPKDRVSWDRYRVHPGDSLITIAKHFDSRVNLIKQVNNLQSHIIHSGQELLIPRAHKLLNDHDVAVARYSAAIHQANLGPKRVTHQVKQGETLASIAKHYHIKTTQIRFWNKHVNPNAVKPGSKLTLWLHNGHSKHPTELPIMTVYKVETGDSLSVIAQRYHTTATLIRHVNKLSNNTIHPGDTVLIPSSKISLHTSHSTKHPSKHRTHHKHSWQHYTVHNGENLIKIAHKLGTTAAQLQEWNPKLKGKYIYPGQSLAVYL